MTHNLRDAAFLFPQLPSFADGHVFDQPGIVKKRADSIFVDVLWFGIQKVASLGIVMLPDSDEVGNMLLPQDVSGGHVNHSMAV